MGSVGLLYVGAVLFVNGVMLLGLVEARSATPINFFVGFLQVLTPTYLIFTSGGDRATILGASGLYLFGFTYLYVALSIVMNLDSTGGGYFYGFVAICALVFSGLNFWFKIDGVRWGDNAFGVIWLLWAFLWGLFFVLLALKKDGLARYTGAVAAIQGWVTGAVPAFLLLTGKWSDNTDWYAVVLAIFAVVAFGGLFFLAPQLRRSATAGQPAAATA